MVLPCLLTMVAASAGYFGEPVVDAGLLCLLAGFILSVFADRARTRRFSFCKLAYFLLAAFFLIVAGPVLNASGSVVLDPPSESPKVTR